MGLFSPRTTSTRSGRGSRIGTILIVEDEPLVAFDNEHALAQAGYHVLATVDRYGTAVAAMGGGAVDLIVADVRLPGRRSGIDLARHAHSRNVPVLFATATCPADAQEFAVGWLAKPYAARDLVRAIRVVERVLKGTPPRLVPEPLTLFARS